MISPKTARGAERRFLAVVLPELINELAWQHTLELSHEDDGGPSALRGKRTPYDRTPYDRTPYDRTPYDRTPYDRLPNAAESRSVATPSAMSSSAGFPSAVVLTQSATPNWDSRTRLDAVNFTARRRGVRPRQTLAEATAMVSNLKILALPVARVSTALKHIAEVALGFGSPVSFEEPDTIWVEITGSCHLFGSEQALASELISSVRALGHMVRVGVASGPWLARALARHASLDTSDIFALPTNQTFEAVGALSILALPVDPEVAAWFARLGLLTIDDLRKLPPAALAARIPQVHPELRPESPSGSRLPGLELGHISDLIRGDDESVLIPYRPEEIPSEELYWDEPLNNVEPLLFVLKGLARRLGARLEGRGQAAQDLLLTIHHDRTIAALESAATGVEIQQKKELSLRLATPLVHAEDLERIVRCRLQREVLDAPAIGLELRATSVTQAQGFQLDLSAALGLRADVSPTPQSIALLVAELAVDIGSDAVGVLAASDSHLLEKSSYLTAIPALIHSAPIHSAPTHSAPTHPAPTHPAPTHPAEHSQPARHTPRSRESPESNDANDFLSSRLPTRLLSNPLELSVPLEKNELWMLREQPFLIESIRFEERLEAIDWWEHAPVFRDYFRVWLGAIDSRRSAREGMEVLAYFDRKSGKSYVQALYD